MNTSLFGLQPDSAQATLVPKMTQSSTERLWWRQGASKQLKGSLLGSDSGSARMLRGPQFRYTKYTALSGTEFKIKAMGKWVQGWNLSVLLRMSDPDTAGTLRGSQSSWCLQIPYSFWLGVQKISSSGGAWTGASKHLYYYMFQPQYKNSEVLGMQ